MFQRRENTGAKLSTFLFLILMQLMGSSPAGVEPSILPIPLQRHCEAQQKAVMSGKVLLLFNRIQQGRARVLPPLCLDLFLFRAGIQSPETGEG